MKTAIPALLLFCTLSGQLYGADESPSIDDFAFLTGYWEGTGFGGQSEEMWMPPRDGRMFGIFKQSNDGVLQFSEFIEIAKEEDPSKDDNGNFVVRLRHFNNDFTAWEDKEEYVTFPLLAVSGNKAEFEGLTYELVSPEELHVSLRLFRSDGSQNTEVFRFHRKKLE